MDLTEYYKRRTAEIEKKSGRKSLIVRPINLSATKLKVDLKSPVNAR